MNANAGFRGSRSDEDMLAGGPVSTQPRVTDDEGDNTPCTEDEEFFQGRPDADDSDMEEEITKFFYGMERQERSGFKDLHSGCLPLPVAKGYHRMPHSEALEGGFIPKMDEEEQKRFTP